MANQDLLNGGLVNSRDEMLLGEGELTVADEAYYVPDDPAPRPVPGRNHIATLAEPRGLAYCHKPLATDLILAHGGSAYRYATVGEGARSFTDIRTYQSSSDPTVVVPVLPGTSFEVAQLGNLVALVNGTTAMLVKDPTALATTTVNANTEISKLGLDTPAAMTATVTAGLWGETTGTFWYWYTEYNTYLDIESPASAVVSATITDAATQAIAIVLPSTPKNPEATHYRLYRSLATASGASYRNPFPGGFLAAQVTPATPSFTDGGIPNYTTPFPQLYLAIAGLTVPLNIEKHGIAPTPSTITVYENSWVANDVLNPTHVRYTPPDEPGAWPNEYFINIELGDSVVRLLRLGRVVVALMNNHVVRINYLPRQGDSEFNRGRVWDPVSTSVGIANARAATVVTFDDGTPLIVFLASNGGLYVTDGFVVKSLVSDLDLAQFSTDYSSAVVRDFSALQLLAVYFRPAGATTNTKAVYLHYDHTHRKEGGLLKVTGTITVPGEDAIYLPSKNLIRPTMATMGADGRVYLEDRATAPLPMVVRSRKHMGRPPTERTRITRLWIRHSNGVGGGVVRLVTQAPNEHPEALPPTSFDTGEAKLVGLEIQREVQNFQVEIESYVPVSFWFTED